MKKQLAKIYLPNNQEVFCLKADEAKILYQQVQGYLKYGIVIKEGDIIFDVGANIGLFALMINNLCDGKADIFAFEPMPSIFAALDQNANKYNSDKINVFQIGLGKQPRTVEFTHYPNATAISTMYPDSSGEEKQQFAATIRDNTEKLPFPFSLIKFLPHSMFCLITDKLTDFAYFEQKIECQIKTISQIIEEQLINQIDLLKIDVEKAELDVLQGINSEDWIKIKQVIVEVHNINDRVLFIYELLRERGFSKIKQEQDPVFRHLDIYNIYASR